MNIGYMYDMCAYPPRGGNHRHVFELVKGFSDRGLKVHVMNDPTMPFVKNYDETPEGIMEFTGMIDLLYVRIDSRPIRKWSSLKACIENLGKKPIIFEINSPADENLAFSWLGGDKKDNESELRKIRRWIHAVKQMPGIILEDSYRKKIGKKVASAVCISSAIERYSVEKLGIKNTLVLPNGGPLIERKEIEKYWPKKRNNDFVVLYTGSAIYPWQGLNYLKDVIRISSQRSLGIRFVLAVNEKTDTLPGGDNVEIFEGCNEEKIRELICTSDACMAIIPEWPWAKYGFHGSPTKVFEYMGNMAAVITSKHGQMAELFTHRTNALLCENNTEAILAEILYLKNHEHERRSIAENGWQLIQEKLNWKYVVDRTLDLFEYHNVYKTK